MGQHRLPSWTGGGTYGERTRLAGPSSATHTVIPLLHSVRMDCMRGDSRGHSTEPSSTVTVMLCWRALVATAVCTGCMYVHSHLAALAAPRERTHGCTAKQVYLTYSKLPPGRCAWRHQHLTWQQLRGAPTGHIRCGPGRGPTMLQQYGPLRPFPRQQLRNRLGRWLSPPPPPPPPADHHQGPLWHGAALSHLPGRVCQRVAAECNIIPTSLAVLLW